MPLEGRKGVLLDRDGVLSKAVFWDGRWRAPRRESEFEFLPGVGAAIGRLRDAGLMLAVVTNQPDIGAGITASVEVDAMHRRIRAELGIAKIYVCTHTDADNCDCRKPRPGLLRRAAVDLDFDLDACYMVGDRWRDISAGHSAGCRTVLVGDGGGESFPTPPDLKARDLAEAADLVLSELSPKRMTPT